MYLTEMLNWYFLNTSFRRSLTNLCIYFHQYLPIFSTLYLWFVNNTPHTYSNNNILFFTINTIHITDLFLTGSIVSFYFPQFYYSCKLHVFYQHGRYNNIDTIRKTSGTVFIVWNCHNFFKKSVSWWIMFYIFAKPCNWVNFFIFK